MKEEKINISKLFWYLVIFSIIGLIIETIYCYVTMGIIESRKGLIWGPFCPVYGFGATALIIALDRFKDSNLKVFVYGAVLGNVIEYLLSYMLEAMYGSRFWDYGYIVFNLNGRICILYSIFWGLLSIILVKFMKKLIDGWIDKIPVKIGNLVEKVLFVFLVLDCICTAWAIMSYQSRIEKIYYNLNDDVQLQGIKKVKANIEEKLFSNDKMVKTFPNLRYVTSDGEEIYIRDIMEQ